MDMVKSYDPQIVVSTFVPTRVLYYLFYNFRESKNCPEIRVWEWILSNVRKATCSMEQAGLLFMYLYYITGFDHIVSLRKEENGTLIYTDCNAAEQTQNEYTDLAGGGLAVCIPLFLCTPFPYTGGKSGMCLFSCPLSSSVTNTVHRRALWEMSDAKTTLRS